MHKLSERPAHFPQEKKNAQRKKCNNVTRLKMQRANSRIKNEVQLYYINFWPCGSRSVIYQNRTRFAIVVYVARETFLSASGVAACDH